MKKQSKQHPEWNGEFVDVPVRVRYADTDMMGVVYYGNYPVFFEIGRSEYPSQPINRMAAIKSDVAMGRRMKGSEMLMLEN